MENSGKQKRRYKEKFYNYLITATLLRHLSAPQRCLCLVFFSPLNVLPAHRTALDITAMSSLARLTFAHFPRGVSHSLWERLHLLPSSDRNQKQSVGTVAVSAMIPMMVARKRFAIAAFPGCRIPSPVFIWVGHSGMGCCGSKYSSTL